MLELIFISSIVMALVFLPLLAWKWKVSLKVAAFGGIFIGGIAGLIVYQINLAVPGLNMAFLVIIEFILVWLITFLMTLRRSECGLLNFLATSIDVVEGFPSFIDTSSFILQYSFSVLFYSTVILYCDQQVGANLRQQKKRPKPLCDVSRFYFPISCDVSRLLNFYFSTNCQSLSRMNSLYRLLYVHPCQIQRIKLGMNSSGEPMIPTIIPSTR